MDHHIVVSTPIHFIPCLLVTLNDSLWTGMVNMLIMDAGEWSRAWVKAMRDKRLMLLRRSGVRLVAHQEFHAL